MIFSFLFIYIFVVNIVYYVVHIVCEVDIIANSLVLYLPFCSTLNKHFFSLLSLIANSSRPLDQFGARATRKIALRHRVSVGRSERPLRPVTATAPRSFTDMFYLNLKQ